MIPVPDYRRRPLKSQEVDMVEFLLSAGYTQGAINRALPCPLCHHPRELIGYDPGTRAITVSCISLGCAMQGLDIGKPL